MLKRLRTGALLGVCAALTALVVAGYLAGALDDLERTTVDARFSVRDTHAPPRDIVVVGIDDVTFDDLRTQFPFPRGLHARLIQRLTRAGAKVIAYDIQFTEPSSSPAQDNELITAVSRAPGVVLGTSESDARGRTAIFGGGDILRQIGAQPGSTILPVDPGGRIRHLADTNRHLRAFALVAAQRALRHRLGPVPAHAYIDYVGGPRTVPTYSFSRVLDGRVPASALRGKIVVVGAKAASP
jgi:adenylate cyclase